MVTRKIANGFIKPVEEVVDSALFQEEPLKKATPVIVPLTANVVVEEEPLIVKKVEPLVPELESKPKVTKKEPVQPRHPRNVPRFTEVAL